MLALQYAPSWGLGLLALLSLGAAGYALYRKNAKRTAALLLACGIAFGSCYATVYDLLFMEPARRYADTEQTVTVTLAAYPQAHTFGAKAAALWDVGAAAPVKVQLYGDEALLSCAPGDRITTEARVRSAETVRGKHITTFTSKGISLLVYGRSDMTVERAESVPLRYLPLYFSHVLQEKIAALYEGEEQILMTALLTGAREEFDDTMYSLLSETGITHVTAVSGMHCVFLFAMVRMLVRSRRKAALISLPMLFFFMLMVGAVPSVMRACFMLTLLSLAPLVHRENDSITSMGAALLIILLCGPGAATSISLQLSFLSVAGMLLFSDKIYQALARRFIPERKPRTFRRLLFSALAVTFGASVFTIPLSAYYFGCVSLVSPLTNLLCLWAVSFAFYGGLLSVAVGFVFMPIAQIIAILPAAALEYFMAVVRFLARLPYHALYTSNPYLVWWLIYFYAMIAVLVVSKNKRRRTNWAVGIAAAATLCLVVALPVLSNGRAQMTASVLNVGQGESVLISAGGETALVDCGSSNSWINAGSIAANEINTLGHTELTYLILTHYHNDHANGLETLFSRLRVRHLILPELSGAENQSLLTEILALAEENGTEVTLLRGEEAVRMNAVTFRIFPPLGRGSSNEEGLSLLCSCGDFDMLVTGDMDSDTEQALLDYTAFEDVEVLVVGHHGSKYSTGSALLQALEPEAAVIPVGDKSYGHPAPETLARLEDAGAQVWRTDARGTVTVRVY